MACAGGMSTMNIPVPNDLNFFMDEPISQRGYGTSSEYVREWICEDQDRLLLRSLLLAGATSSPATPADARHFDGLRSWPLTSFPDTVFYVERQDGVDEWRVLHSLRDMAVWLQEPDEG